MNRIYIFREHLWYQLALALMSVVFVGALIGNIYLLYKRSKAPANQSLFNLSHCSQRPISPLTISGTSTPPRFFSAESSSSSFSLPPISSPPPFPFPPPSQTSPTNLAGSPPPPPPPPMKGQNFATIRSNAVFRPATFLTPAPHPTRPTVFPQHRANSGPQEMLLLGKEPALGSFRKGQRCGMVDQRCGMVDSARDSLACVAQNSRAVRGGALGARPKTTEHTAQVSSKTLWYFQ